MIETCDAPCIFIRVVIAEKNIIGKEMFPSPVFRRHGNLRESATRSEGKIKYSVLYTTVHDVSMRFVQGGDRSII
jgi:hypothetical protein